MSLSLEAVDLNPFNVSTDLEVERLFKKSVRIAPKPTGSFYFCLSENIDAFIIIYLFAVSCSITECLSTLDLREGCDESEASMGKRSRSVPGLDLQVRYVHLI